MRNNKQTINKVLKVKSEVMENSYTRPDLISKWKGAVSSLKEATNIINNSSFQTCYICTVKESFGVSLVVETFEISKDSNDLLCSNDLSVGDDSEYKIINSKLGDFFIPINTVRMYTPENPLEFCIQVTEGLSVKLYLSYSYFIS